MENKEKIQAMKDLEHEEGEGWICMYCECNVQHFTLEGHKNHIAWHREANRQAKRKKEEDGK